MNEKMSYSFFCLSLPRLPGVPKGTWLIDNRLRCALPKPLQGFGVKKYGNKFFTELIAENEFQNAA